MTEAQAKPSNAVEPRFPTLVAAGLFSLWVALLSLPMLQGRYLASPYSDQYGAGYGFRAWAAEQWKSTGHVPLWNAEIFGGMPFVAGMHGDIFYPTAWLRLVAPVHVAMNIGFLAHYVLAALFMYLFLRQLRVSWSGAVVGGIAYQLSGVIGSYVNPGHDGKLFVTALFPLAMLALVMALREKRFIGYSLLALAVGLAFLAPHPQLLYYMLLATGLFALYLTFGEPTDQPLAPRLTALAGSLGAVLVGFGVGAIQMVPFYFYIPFSPRAEGLYGWERAITFGIPWDHVPEFFLARFSGASSAQTYWGSNGLKLHSEYLGLPVLALAVLGAGDRRRRLVLWLGGIGLLFLLVSLSGSTPFYRLWFAVMPFMDSVRAAGMAFFLVAFVVATLAALGMDRLLAGGGAKHPVVWLAAAGAVMLMALVGAWSGLASALARGVEGRTGFPSFAVASNAADAIRWGAFGSGMFLAAVAGAAVAFRRRRIPVAGFTIAVVAIVGTDLWWNARPFWNYSNAHNELFGGDQITEYMADTPLPFRVLNLPGGQTEAYRGSALMAYHIPELLGHHANELDAFDRLMGRENGWNHLLSNLGLWDLYAVRFAVFRSGVMDSLPGFRRVLTDVPVAGGGTASLFERVDPPPYARFIPTAAKVAEPQIVPTVVDPRFPLDRVVLFDSTAGVDPPPLTRLPDSTAFAVEVVSWEPGAMQLRIDPPAATDGYVLVSENWYIDWHASVDGRAAEPLRGNGALLTVPVTAGDREITLTFESAAYRLGKTITLLSAALIAVGFVAPVVLRRARRG